MSSPSKRVTTAKELAELTRQIRNLQKRQKRAEAKAASHPPKARGHGKATLRCQASSATCMMVYVLAGFCTKVAVDFMVGCGWRRRKSVCRDEEVEKTLAGEVEDALLSLPLSALVALETDPLTHFEFCDLLCSHKYVMEHKLHEWISSQNINHGVAPSRDQVVAELPQCIHEHAPPEIQRRLSGFVQGTARKQRMWLARFRKRWGLGYGTLKAQELMSVEEKRQKAPWIGINGLSGSLVVPN